VASIDAAVDLVSAQARAEADQSDIVGSIPTDRDAFDGPRARQSEFVRANPDLFSAAEDKRPWPLANSPEAKAIEKRDHQREKELSKVTQICRC
jgi:hypothetical protein